MWEIDECGKEVVEVPYDLKIILEETQPSWERGKESRKGRAHNLPLLGVVSLSGLSSNSSQDSPGSSL